MAKHARTTRRALFGAALALPAAILAAPAWAESLANDERWASIARSAASLDPTGPEVVRAARRLGFDPDDCTGLYKDFTHGRRLLMVFARAEAPGEFEPVHIDRSGIVEWRTA